MGESAYSRKISRWTEVYASTTSGSTNAGKLAAQAWMQRRGLSTPALMPWHVEVSLDVRDAPATIQFDERTDTRFRIEIYSEEWGFFFCHLRRTSWIRVTDIPFVHGRDDFHLLPLTPALEDLASLFRSVEQQHAIRFRREHALVRTNIPSAELAVRVWIAQL
jgi:hypothetical protein